MLNSNLHLSVSLCDEKGGKHQVRRETEEMKNEIKVVSHYANPWQQGHQERLHHGALQSAIFLIFVEGGQKGGI
jgi:hypothetical protein